jgi:hypothetical protein
MSASGSFTRTYHGGVSLNIDLFQLHLDCDMTTESRNSGARAEVH